MMKVTILSILEVQKSSTVEVNEPKVVNYVYLPEPTCWGVNTINAVLGVIGSKSSPLSNRGSLMFIFFGAWVLTLLKLRSVALNVSNPPGIPFTCSGCLMNKNIQNPMNANHPIAMKNVV